MPLSVVDVLSIVDDRSARSRVRSHPHHQADPFEVALLAELPQRHVDLFLQLWLEVGPHPSAIEERTERRLRAQLAEGASDRKVGKGVRAVLEKRRDEGRWPVSRTSRNGTAATSAP